MFMSLQGGAPVRNRVQLVKITPISLWFMVDISNYYSYGLYESTNICLGGAHVSKMADGDGP